MQAEQRATKSAEAFAPVGRPWTPFTVHGPTGDELWPVEVGDGDRYVAVDDVADGHVVFEVSDWPELDAEGRLHWETEPRELWDEQAAVQERLEDERREQRITAPERRVRVGDTFLVRGLPSDSDSLLAAETIVDVSAAARDAAKAALYGAAASTVDAEDAAALHVGSDYETAETAAGAFDVRQQRAPDPPPLGPEAAS